MDIENLIERLNNYSAEYQRHGGITVEAADALSILRDENAKLRNSRDRWRKCAEEFSAGVNQRDNETEKLQAENEKLRDELDQVKRERDAAVEDVAAIIGDVEEIRQGYGVDNADADGAFARLCETYCANNGCLCYAEGEKYHCKNFKWRGI